MACLHNSQSADDDTGFSDSAAEGWPPPLLLVVVAVGVEEEEGKRDLFFPHSAADGGRESLSFVGRRWLPASPSPPRWCRMINGFLLVRQGGGEESWGFSEHVHRSRQLGSEGREGSGRTWCSFAVCKQSRRWEEKREEKRHDV